ncbi:hypothetical protein AB0M19_28340 [Streptomyces sp. NPDC051920]|uniref:hypothetical protein n=1 Tax=Streptomyces sp. NPDC051920 TaxID=3155523 RepID=UPI00341C7991
MYGNVTVLGAVASVGTEQTLNGRAAILVLVTAASTFVAHVLAELVGQSIETPARPQAHAVRRDVRDAWPIATSGTPSALLLAFGAWGVLSSATAQLLAACVILVRLALTGWIVEWLSGRRASVAALWGGFVLAAIGAAIAAVKVAVSH